MAEPHRISSARGDPAVSVRRAELLLQGLRGVSSARIVADSRGQIEEIHVLTDHKVEPKQTVRNVESALAAELGIEVDHRKISVAQTRDPDSGEAARIIGIGQWRGERRYHFAGYEFDRKLAHRIECRVRLRLDQDEFLGRADGADIENARLGVAARAALDALETAEENTVSFALDTVKVIDAFDVPVIVAGIYGLSGRKRVFLAGAAPVTEAEEHAAILAALKATNRWIVTAQTA